MIQQLIDRYKRFRTERFLAQTYQYSYAFVGMGLHSLTNLYPVLRYLGVPLKYICVTSERKAILIEKKFPQVKAITSLETILNDEEVKGVFVSASPSAHFLIASQILKSGKAMFIEKPPCQSLQELEELIDIQRLYGSSITMVGLQKRYAPAITILQKRMGKEHFISYDLHYLTGKYPEGNPLLDLYIHPLDLVCFLFGKPEILVCQQVAPASYIIMLRHPNIVGTLELSTSYTWTAAEESLKVCTSSGIYRLSQMETLTFEPKPSTILGIPIEKIHKYRNTIVHLNTRTNFTPVLPNNQLYSQGFFNEIQAFVDTVETGHNRVITDLQTVRNSYEIITEMQKAK